MKIVSEREVHDGKPYRLISPDGTNIVWVPIENELNDDADVEDQDEPRRRGRPRKVTHAA